MFFYIFMWAISPREKWNYFGWDWWNVFIVLAMELQIQLLNPPKLWPCFRSVEVQQHWWMCVAPVWLGCEIMCFPLTWRGISAMINHVFSPLAAIHRGFHLQGTISFSFYCHHGEVPTNWHILRELGADLSEMCRGWANSMYYQTGFKNSQK